MKLFLLRIVTRTEFVSVNLSAPLKLEEQIKVGLDGFESNF